MSAEPRRRSRPLLRVFLCSGALIAAATSVLRAASPSLLSEQPLASKSGPRGATMFTSLPPEQTGIVAENRYADPQMWSERFPEFTLGAIGTGVAIGDFDNDGRPDIFVVSKTESPRLFRNLGEWKFEDVTAKSGLSGSSGALVQGVTWMKSKLGGAETDASIWKQGAVFADVDNDGWLDLYVCRFGAPNLLFINQRDGTFKEEAAARGLAVIDASGMAAFCDYDRDGWLDVYVQTNLLDSSTHPTGQRDYLFHNNGNGTFTNVTDQAGITGETQGHSAIWWDYDDDGWPDLYVANDFAVPDSLYHNRHDGTFVNVIGQVVPHLPFSSMGSDFGDVNNDGLLDYFVPDMAATTHEKDQRGMAASRALNTDEPASSGIPPQYARNALYVNTGTGVCLEAACLAGLAATDWTWSPRFEDLDNDGRVDLHIANGMVRELHNVDILARVMVAETPAERIRAMRSQPVLSESNLAYRNLGDLEFENVSDAWGLDQKGVSFGSALGDLDGDGDLDLVYANYERGPTVLRNDSDTGHRLIVALRGTRSNRFGVGAVVRIETAHGPQVRALVLSRGILSSSEPVLHFGLGDDTRIDRLSINWPSGVVQTFSNLTADRRLTITEPSADQSQTEPKTAAAVPRPAVQFVDITAASGLSHTAHESATAPEAREALLPFRQNRRGPALVVARLGANGGESVIVGGTTQEGAVALSRSGGVGAFAKTPLLASTGPAALSDGPIVAFDADGNGTTDLLVTKCGTRVSANSAAYQPVLYRGDGAGMFSLAADAVPELRVSAGAVAAADFDRDGQLDVFIGGRVLPGRYPLPARSALLRNQGGRFEEVTDRLAPGLRQIGLATSALWSDVDGDGWIDLLVALDWGAVRYFHNEAGRGFTDYSERAGFLKAGTGWWTSLAAADFNGDGRPDFVAGNVGLNTQYRADPDHPAVLYAGHSGSVPVVIEGYYEGEKLFPWRSRKDVVPVLPSIAKKFPRNDAYARATLDELLGEAALTKMTRFAATELRSGVFLSQADGTYSFQPLPRIAQIAPLQGIVAGDFDGDGSADIFAVQNSYSPIPVVGHFDGGVSQLLRGDGHGRFLPVTPAESGLVVRGDAKALVVADLNEDGWPDFVASRNDQSTLAYQNTPKPGRHSFGVRLKGPAGNSSAIGARITVELMKGTSQTAEVGAGGGYFSQSSATLFFGYAEENFPRRAIVRWPSGAQTTHDLPRDRALVEIEAPKG